MGNLILKTKSITSEVVWQRGNWAYYWLANGMLQQVKRPDGSLVEFEYDALGRRTAKIADGKVNRYVWDGNLLLHEWSYDAKDRPRLVVQEKGQLNYDRKELAEDVTTWVYDDSGFTPSAKLVGSKQYSIIADYLGTPVEAYDEKGNKVWFRELDCYGGVRKGDNLFVPFLYQGQYWDEETGLAYNRFRYYDAKHGKYVTKDPIGLEGGSALYNYVHDTNRWIDEYGLAKTPTRTLQRNWQNHVGSPHTNPDIHHGFPEEHAQRFRNVADIDVNNPKYYYNLPKEAHTKKPGIHTNSSRTGQNWNKTWDGILNRVESMNLSKAESKSVLESALRTLARKERISKYNADAVKYH